MHDEIKVHIMLHFNKKVLEAGDDASIRRDSWSNWLSDMLEVCQLLLNIFAVLYYWMLCWMLNVILLRSIFCPLTSLHRCCSQLRPCSLFLFSWFYFFSCASPCVVCVPLAVHQWLLNTTAHPNIDVRLWKAWTLRLWSLKRWSAVWKTPGRPVPRVQCRYEPVTNYWATSAIWIESIHTSWTKN